MARAPYSGLLAQLELRSGDLAKHVTVPGKEFLVGVAADPDVRDWLISVSEIDKTRGE
jgi:hypothetical protein